MLGKKMENKYDCLSVFQFVTTTTNVMFKTLRNYFSNAFLDKIGHILNI